MTVKGLERSISAQLLTWSAVSILSGTGLLFAGPFWRGAGLQFVIWGAVDAGIALFGRWQARRQNKPDAARLKKLQRALLVNAGLDVLYVLAGALVLIFADGAFAAGNGWGVIIQGGFLLLFDLWHGVVSVRQAAIED